MRDGATVARVNVSSEADFTRAVTEAQELIAHGRPAEAVAMVEGGSGPRALLVRLRAVVYSAVHDDRATLLKGVELWRKLGPDKRPEAAFQLAAALHAVVELTMRTDGKVAVIERDRHLVREARLTYLAAAEHEEGTDQLKLVSLVNCGNLFDSMGREVDALQCYDRALEIDSGFGMALGNRGMALAKIAPFMGGHQSHVLEEAAWLLDRSFEDEERIRATGDPRSLDIFRDVRANIRGGEPEPPDHGDGPRFSDQHLCWAFEHGLLLHISPACLEDDASSVDALHLGSMVWSIEDDEQARLKRLRDAFNTVKQDFIAARYSLWLASDPASPIREHTDAVSARGYFADTLSYARWGIRTGMGLQALTAATNTLDKIAGLVHLYFATDRKPKDVSFYGLWHRPPTKGQPLQMEPVFAEQLRHVDNEGLAAIIDLSCEVDGDRHRTPLKEQIARRHAATHRFLVAHDLPMYEQDEAKWLTRVDWSDVVVGTIEQLRVTRAALIYLARAIAAREAASDHEGQIIPRLPSYAVETFDMEP